jgi:hypothetical protein
MHRKPVFLQLVNNVLVGFIVDELNIDSSILSCHAGCSNDPPHLIRSMKNRYCRGSM